MKFIGFFADFNYPKMKREGLPVPHGGLSFSDMEYIKYFLKIIFINIYSKIFQYYNEY